MTTNLCDRNLLNFVQMSWRRCPAFPEENVWIVLHWFVLFLALFSAAVAVPCSLLWNPSHLTNECTNLNARVEFLNNATHVLEEFATFTRDAEHSLDIVIALPPAFSQTPPLFTEVLYAAIKRGVTIRIFTNSHDLSVPAGVKVKYFTQPYTFSMNFAVRDSDYIFIPSSFFGFNGDMKSPAVSFLASFGKCESAGQDLLSLFDLLWNRKKNVQEYKWMAGYGFNPTHHELQFLLDPPELYPIGRKNHTSVIFDSLDWASDQKIVFTSNIFPDNMSDVHSAYVGATVSGLFELNQYNEEPLKLVVSRAQFDKNREAFHSLISNTKVPSLSLCSIDFDGTMIVSKTRLVLSPSGISDVFTGKTVMLGIVLDGNYIDTAYKLQEILLSDKTCVEISPPQ